MHWNWHNFRFVLEQSRKKCGNFFLDWKCISSIENRNRCCFYGKSRRFDICVMFNIYIKTDWHSIYGKCVWFRDRCRSRFVWKILLNKNEEFDSTWFERWCHAQSTTHIFFIIYLLLHGDSANKNCVKSASETTTASNCINKYNCIFATTR